MNCCRIVQTSCETGWLITIFHLLLQIFWPSLAFCRKEKKKLTVGGGTVWKPANAARGGVI